MPRKPRQKTIHDFPDWMDAAEVAEYMGESIQTVYRLARTGEIKCHHFSSRRVRFYKWELPGIPEDIKRMHFLGQAG